MKNKIGEMEQQENDILVEDCESRSDAGHC